MGPRYRAPRNPTRSQTSSAKTVQTWHYILGKQLTALNDINALRARGSVYCSSRVKVHGVALDGRELETGERLTAYYTGRGERANWRPDMDPRVAAALGIASARA